MSDALPSTMPPAADDPRDSWSPRQVDFPGVVASVFIVLTAMAGVAVAWAAGNVHGVVRGYYDDAAVTDADLDSADGLMSLAGIVYTGVAIGAAIAFIVWLWRARQNAERISDGQHTRARGWAIGAWFVPIVNLWFPYQVVRDVWRASNPETRETGGELSHVRRSGLLPLWWLAWLVALMASQISRRLSLGDDPQTQDGWLRYFEQVATAETVSAAGDVVAAALVIVLIRQVSRWQTAALRQGAPAAQ